MPVPGNGGSAAADAAQQLGAMRPMLLRIARLQLHNDDWAQDAVSETLLAALEGSDSFRQASQLQTWVVGILKHKIIDQFRRHAREVSLDATHETDEGDTLDALFEAGGHRVSAPLDWGDPETTLSRSEFMAVLQTCLDDLPPALGRIFLLREWLELETPEICKELAVTSTNCFVMLYRARMRLRECLEIRWFAGNAGRTST